MSFLIQDDFVDRHYLLKEAYIFLDEPNRIEILLFGMIFIFVIFFIKFLYSVFFVWWQQYFSNEIMVNISNKLFTKFLKQPYSNFLNRNSSEMLNILQREASNFHGTIVQSISLFAEATVVTSIILMLLIIEPEATIFAMLTIFAGALIFNLFARKYILKWGKLRIFHSEKVIKHSIQGLNGIKDIKILNLENSFIKSFERHNTKYLKVNRWNNTIQALPRLWLEIVAVLSFVVLVFTLSLQNRSIDSILPILGLIGIATFRILPSMNRLLSAYQSILFQIPAVDVIYNELYKYSQPKNTNQVQKNNFELRNINISVKFQNIEYTYPKSNRVSLKDISFEVNSGDSIGIIGKSGAGKSTLTDILLGLLEPHVGSIKFIDSNSGNEIKDYKSILGYVPQTIYLTDDTLKNNIAFGEEEEFIDTAAINNILGLCQLTDFVKTLPNGIDTFVGDRGLRLSGGQKHRIGIARALYKNPSILVLDEATSAVDNLTEIDIMNSLKKLNNQITLIIISHRLSTVLDCDKIIELENGKVINIVKKSEVGNFIANKEK
tara:strand:- start:44802 stop:46448 length:1647 start_codon:yes stop_codon:yes gene_type:complete